MKNRLITLLVLAIAAVTYSVAADYAAISGEPLSSLNKQTDLVGIVYNTTEASFNGNTYISFRQHLGEKQIAKFDADMMKLHQYVIKQFNKANKRGFQLTDQNAHYTAEIKIKKLTFSDSKDRAKITAVIDIRESGSPQVVTQIKLTNFEGGKRKGTFQQLKQLSKDIIEYLSIYL